MKVSDFPCGKKVAIQSLGSWPAAGHYYERDQIKAVVAAWHAGRPLLVKGEPGVGKSQLASAVAQVLGWQFICINIQPRTEYQDLLWELDAVARLAQAQMSGALNRTNLEQKASSNEEQKELLSASLRREKFIIPGPLWWALRPISAEIQNKNANRTENPFLVEKPKNTGVVLLIDEIDKADANLPNGLLEILGNGDFGLPIERELTKTGELRKPLILITSNDERQLPPAFLRRCLVLTIKLPDPGELLINHLVELADAHVKSGVDSICHVPVAVMKSGAKLISEIRENSADGERPPGAAEYLDLMRVIGGIGGSNEEMIKNMQELHEIVLIKETTEESRDATAFA